MAATMNLASSAQLEIIDQLRALGISNFVALPQVKYLCPPIEVVADL
jgi:hypothetical protein